MLAIYCHRVHEFFIFFCEMSTTTVFRAIAFLPIRVGECVYTAIYTYIHARIAHLSIGCGHSGETKCR